MHAPTVRIDPLPLFRRIAVTLVPVLLAVTSPGAGAGPSENGLAHRVAALEAELAALRSLFTLAADGTLTIAPTGDLVLDAGAGREVKVEKKAMLMEDAQVMGETELEGDAMMMQGATVMGEAMLEGDTMMMEDATIMGQATLEGQLVIPPNGASVDATGALVFEGVNSTSIRVTEADTLLLAHVPPSVDGTVVELTNNVETAAGDARPLFVRNCQFASGGCFSGTPAANVLLKQSSSFYRMEPEDTLRLKFNETIFGNGFWREVSRSGGAETFFANASASLLFLVAGDQATFFDRSCEDGADGRPGAALLGVHVQRVGGTGVASTTILDDRLVPQPPDGREIERVSIQVENVGPGWGTFEVLLRCLSV